MRLLPFLLLAGAALGAQPTVGGAYRPGVDVLDYDLTLELPERGSGFEGRAVITARRTARMDTLVLDLRTLRVDSVSVDGRPVPFVRDSATLRVALAGAARDTVRVAVRYGGAPRDGLIISTDSLGRWMAFGDNWPDRGRHWIPSVDHPSDKATVTWTVSAPVGRRVVANGALVEETPLPGGRVLTRWRESRPIPVYLMVIAAAPLAYYDLGRSACGLSELPGCVQQAVYVAPEVRGFVPGPFASAGDMVEFFARLVGPFPYEKLAHLQSSTRFGGMENAGAIFYSDRAFRRGTLGTRLIAHETAHQWFGDAVTQREWSHLWLSEGFATYFAHLWVRRAEGDSAWRAGLRRDRDLILADSVVALRPVIDTAQADLLALLNANSYQKGGWTLRMLHTLVGDSAFFGGVRAYYAAHRHDTAVTDDLRRAVEGASGVRLDWFFDQWLRRPGFPELTTSWRHDAATRRVTLRVEQGMRFGAHRFPLTVAVTDAGGRIQRVRVEIAAERVVEVTLALELPSRPRTVVVDPDVELLAAIR